jgi:hypothetical protein
MPTIVATKSTFPLLSQPSLPQALPLDPLPTAPSSIHATTPSRPPPKLKRICAQMVDNK